MESLTRLVEEASALALVGVKDIHVRFELDANADLVLADKVQIQQVLLNLMRNGIEAMANSARRELSVTSARTVNDMVEVRVADTGSGIAADVAENLFQPFFTTKPQGMGVGLSICRTIVEAHGGTISAERNPGGGTVFRFTIEAKAQQNIDANV